MSEVLIAILSAAFLFLTFKNVRALNKKLEMGKLQSFTLGILMWIPISFFIVIALTTISMQIVLSLMGLILELSYRLVCGLSGTSYPEFTDMIKNYREKNGLSR